MELNQKWLRQMLQKAFFQKLSELPPEAKTALEKTQVDLVRHPNRIEIVIDSRGDPDVERIKDILLDSLLPPLTQVITFFGCQANVEPRTG